MHSEKIAVLVETVPVPDFPELPEFTALEPSMVQMARIEMPADPNGIAGAQMTFRIYLPPGETTPRSLACVLVAPAGTNLLSGSDLDDGDYHDETLPYAEAGMAVVNYSIDGNSEGDDDDELIESYAAFKKAGAGVINGRNALEFVLARMPMVDPDRIYSAGHSSAATLSLLLAAHEPRLKACLAYAPAVDLESHFSDILEDPEIELILPGASRFVTDSSPLTHANQIQIPVFLFFAEDDTMATLESAKPFVDALQSTNPRVRLHKVPTGGHYNSMIDKGIPAGIRWIKNDVDEQ
jgi:dipeptidyl aminopeptidase/acylaminoacyl peptidase